MVRLAPSASSTTSSRCALTKTPTTSSRRFSAAPISTAAAGSHARGLSGWKIIPIAHAPCETASSASGRLVTPQIFTFVLTLTIVDGGSGHDELLRVTARARPDPGRPITKLHFQHPTLGSSQEFELDIVPRLLRVNGRDHLVHRPDRYAVDLRDHVS